MYSDGSEKGLSQCSFAAQARSFGTPPHYWESSHTVSAPMASRLPAAYGHERCSIHTAELMGMLSARRYAKPGAWNLFVGDRSSLFSLITKLSDGPLLKAILRSANIPLASRLSGILARLQVAWPGTPPLPPAWRMHQTMHPHKWNVQQLLLARPAWYSQIAFCNYGLVGVDVRSHQSGEPIPMRIIVAGNEAQDQACNAAMSLPRPTPVSLPTGGTFAYISYHGAMVTSSARDAVRDLLRCQALDEWKLRPVQGKVATLTALVYTPALDMHLYTACSLSLSPPVLHLPHDNISVDLSVALFRCLRLVGGGWTEQIKVQPELLKVAQFLYERNWVGSVRSCPLCRCLPGTPRHVVMSCPVITPLVNQLRNILEAHLHALDSQRHLQRSCSMAE